MMLCRNPFVKAGCAFPCGQCMPCRFNRRRLWSHRIMLENLCHESSSFITLTYGDDYLPVRDGKPVLVTKHLQDWLKRFRAAVSPVLIRFYGVGEYGEDIARGQEILHYGRPHYHILVFGYSTCLRGRTLRGVASDRPVWAECCDVCRIVGNTWSFGDVDLGTVTSDSASYVAAYTVKKMTAYDDIRLNGRTPEFCRMSLRPGIGCDAMWDVASGMLRYDLEKRLDVPVALAHGRSELPLGRYLRGKLRGMVGKDGGTPDEVLKSLEEEMRPLREAAFASSSSFAKAVVAAGDGRVSQIEARNLIYKKRNVL